MRLNVSNYQAILSKKGLDDVEVCKRTGLTAKSLKWLLNDNYTELETLERIADALGVAAFESILPDYLESTENVIEWIKNQKQAALTLCQRRTITRVKELSEKYPKECQIIAENEDGSIFAHIPVGWIRINPPMNLSEEQRAVKAERMRRNVLNAD